MIKINDLLMKKGHGVWSVTPETTVIDSLHYMAEKGVGALLVLDKEKINGIISERDFVRAIAKTKKCMLESPVSDYMTRDVVTISSDKSIEDCMELMTKKHFRHLPVVDNGSLIGMVSIGDVVKEIISIDETRINFLEYLMEERSFDL